MANRSDPLWTVARIAEHLGAARHRVEYIIESRGIQAADRAGIARVFDRGSVDAIRRQIRHIEARREGVTREG